MEDPELGVLTFLLETGKGFLIQIYGTSTNVGRTHVVQYKRRTHKRGTSTNVGPEQTSD